jgi:hypothetical protein
MVCNKKGASIMVIRAAQRLMQRVGQHLPKGQRMFFEPSSSLGNADSETPSSIDSKCLSSQNSGAVYFFVLHIDSLK